MPTARISPISSRILGFVPAPNVNAAEGQINFDQNSVRVKTLDQTDAKVDWVISSNDRLSIRYSLQKAVVTDPGLYGPNRGIYGGPHNGGLAGTDPARTQSPGITFSKVLNPTLVRESRFGIVRNRNDAKNADTDSKTSQTSAFAA